ncbi:ABC transporter permease [Baekduia sp. Peel2402]|uniref:ABC transporter permease n=1 Tax=Baekduia sp. Peel2402 TaxID=3458296 RepID=UPI00403EE781
MTLAETLRIALGGIMANKLRSGLTILGMTIGVASVIVLVAVGNGSKEQVQASVRALGSNVLLVQAGGARGGPGLFGGGSSITLTQDDATALQDTFNVPDVKSASPVVTASSTSLVAGSLSYSSSVTGTTPSYATARNYEVADGEMFTTNDVKKHSRVVVLGPTVVTNLFNGANPVGQTVKMGGSSFTVVGVTKAKGSNGTTDQDDVVFAPLTAVQDALSGYGSINQIVVQAKSEKSLNAAQAEVTAILNERHDIDASASSSTTGTSSSSFQVINQGSILETSDETTSVFTTLLGAVAAISLLVGGIGVMNIMLVSVTERTREIGIRKAIGARRSDILLQFLTEAVLVSMLGGIVGVIVGVVGSKFEIAGVDPVIAFYSIPLSFGAAVLAGLFFGTYPAGRAARLRPIDALRFE